MTAVVQFIQAQIWTLACGTTCRLSLRSATALCVAPARVGESASEAMPFSHTNDVLARLDHLCIGRTRSCLGQLGGEMVKRRGVEPLASTSAKAVGPRGRLWE